MNNFRKTTLAAALALAAAPVFAANFSELDRDRDQRLSTSELEPYAQQLQLSADQLIQSYDQDSDKQLSQTEFTSIATAPMETAEATDTAASMDAAAATSPAPMTSDPAAPSDAMAATGSTSSAVSASEPAPAGPDRTTVTVNQKPAKVTVSNTAPKVTVQQPKPEVTITTQDPVVNVEQPEPQVSVQQAQPRVEVDAGQPVVDVDQAQPRVQVSQPEPEVTTKMAEPVVNVGTVPAETAAQTEWANSSVGDLKGQAIYDQNGQNLGEVVEVVIDSAQQQAGLLVGAKDQAEMSFVSLQDVQQSQDQLQISDAEKIKPLGEIESTDPSQFRTVTDPNRSVQSLLDGAAVSAR